MCRHCLSLLLIPIFAVEAQSTKAELFGIIRDSSGLAVSGAAVALVETGTDSRRSAVSDASGRYRFFALPAGGYRLSIAKDGFTTLRREGIVLRVGDQVSLDLELHVGDMSQSMVVTADAPL